MAAYERAKRVFDVLVSGVAIVVLSPLIAAVAIAVRLRLGRPVLFRQGRAGRGGVPFEVVKFRTMTDAVGPDGVLLPDGDRLTPFGRRLRQLSLDELPQLFNVLRGDISLVGPRPLLERYVPRYSDRQRRRLDVPPGITGWAQVNGRNVLSWPERLELDVWYVENRSFLLDLRILARTFATIVGRKGVSAAGEATMAEFFPTSAEDGEEPAR